MEIRIFPDTNQLIMYDLIKIVLPPNKSEIMLSESLKKEWNELIKFGCFKKMRNW